MPLTFKIAARFLTYNFSQTIIISLGLSIGVAVQMFVGLLIDSLQANLIDRTVGSSPHITISHIDEDKLINRWELLNTSINDISGITITAPVVERTAVIIDEDKSYPVLIKGLNSNGLKLFGLDNALYNGRMPKYGNEVIIGRDLSQEIEIGKNDFVRVSDAKGGQKDMTVVGLFDLKVANLNKTWIITTIKGAQSFFGLRNEITGLEIQVDKVFNADVISQNIFDAKNNNELKVTNWKETNKQLLTALSSQSSSTYMIQIFVLLSVIIAITSILSITVMQKSRQIGILKAMGLKNSQSSIIFIQTSFVIGLIGSTLGTIFGFGLFYGFVNSVKDADGMPVFAPIVRGQYVIVTWAITVAASTLAGYIPARKSAKLDPIEIIQNE